MKSSVNVLHLIDSLESGGAEKVAVNLVNSLGGDYCNAYLCTTRKNGPLLELVKNDIKVLSLNRTKTIDFHAIKTLRDFIKDNQINILHAHSSSLFIAKLVSNFPPYPAFIWHDHYGNHETYKRSEIIYRLGSFRVNGVISVNHQLANWAIDKLKIQKDRVWYIPNFATLNQIVLQSTDLPGAKGSRIICVANFRPQKDHITLIRAMKQVADYDENAHLLLVGNISDQEITNKIKKEIDNLNLRKQISILGQRKDVAAILQACDIGVLSSSSEGLPLSLLEYGLAKLAVVATNVGQCKEVLQNGKVGKLVQPSTPGNLAKEILYFLQNKEESKKYGCLLYNHVNEFYNPEKIIQRISDIYEFIARSKQQK